MTTASIKLPKPLANLFTPPRGSLRWRVAHGGRGSGKSFSFALMAAVWGYAEPLRILCTRELQVSIRESMHAEIKNAIESHHWLAAHYDVGRDYIRGKNGTEFIFRGLRHNISSIKSMAQIDLAIVEEAEDVPAASWQDFIPTIRAPKSEFWVVLNPKRRDSWVAENLLLSQPPRSSVVQINHDSNPWFPAVLDEQRRHDRQTLDPALYAHIWEGEFYEHSDAQVFNGCYAVREFTPQPAWDGPYFGIDWGFSQDPTAGVKAWIHDNTLYIEYDFAQVGLELDDTAQALINALPEIERHTVRADSARPESISYLRRHGLPHITGAKKGKGSVEDGIAHIKSYNQVVIHPRCKETISEFGLYSYKVDRLSGDILPDIVDAYNHVVDSLRYALEPVMRRRSGVMIARA